jgi:serine protease Do
MIKNETSPAGIPGDRQPVSARRLTLLASVAVIGIATLVAGPGGFYSSMQANAAAVESSAPSAQPSDFADLVAKVKPAVISVRVKIDAAQAMAMGDDSDGPSSPQGPGQRFFRFGSPDRQRQAVVGEGSGFFISADGYAVTNNHVVDHASSVQVTTDDGSIHQAKVIGTDPKTDLALIKVTTDKQFPFVKFSDQMPRIGEWVVAVGNPFGLGGTVTAGIVSAKGREIGSNAYDNYMQIDAPINKGNSGGPTFNMNGDVVGVNTAIFSPSGGSVGIGFDIPADTVKAVVDQLKSKGYVTRGWMGVQIQQVTPEIADSLGMKKAEGALVSAPQANSPATKAGIKAGDVITEVNGDAVKDAHALVQTIAKSAPGTAVKVGVLRNGETKTIDLTLGTMPNEQQQARAEDDQSPGGVPHLGLNLAPGNEVEPNGKGVAVVGVEPDGPAANQGIRTGDVILDVAGKPVSSPADVRNAITQSATEGRHAVLMRVQTPQGTRFVAVPLNKSNG